MLCLNCKSSLNCKKDVLIPCRSNDFYYTFRSKKYPQRLFDITFERVEQSARFIFEVFDATNYPTLDRNVWNVKPEVENKWRRQNQKCL